MDRRATAYGGSSGRRTLTSPHRHGRACPGHPRCTACTQGRGCPGQARAWRACGAAACARQTEPCSSICKCD